MGIKSNIGICKCGQVWRFGAADGDCIHANAGPPIAERELRFKRAIVTVLNRGEYPAAGRITLELGLARPSGVLNTIEGKWRREVLGPLGWKQTVRSDGMKGKWVKG
ncbi:hypothetical protein LCGC14_2848340 [marine sediment metagenome]|uniref:Uncharacterized protein n=1 Tax=marine sediment metagenome TaxID=412755 RepID=A0A0F9B040_9ZZZZ